MQQDHPQSRRLYKVYKSTNTANTELGFAEIYRVVNYTKV